MDNEINFLIFLKEKFDINIRGLLIEKESGNIEIKYEDSTGNFISEIKNPFEKEKDKKLFDEMIKNYQNDEYDITIDIDLFRSAMDYVIKRDGYCICIEGYSYNSIFS